MVNDNICVPKNMLFLIIGLILAIFFMFYFFEEKLKFNFNYSNNKSLENNIVNKKIHKKKLIKMKDDLRGRDYKVINDPIHPPERRLPRHIYPKVDIKRVTNIPTRGHPDNYQLMGIVTRESDEKVMQLFGRQTYPGSSQYEYYIRGKDLSGLEVKFPLNIENDKELYNNDVVNIPQLNASKGDFKVTLYELNAPKYNPNI